MQERVYRNRTDIHSTDELKQWLTRVSCDLDQDTVDTSDVKDFEHVSKVGFSTTACELTMTVYDLFCVLLLAQILGTVLYCEIYKIC